MNTNSIFSPDMSVSSLLFIEMRDITKIYPNGVYALVDVNFDLKPCEVHCLLGENGAGKSTLMKILAGVLKPTKGEILINGVPAEFDSPLDAQKYGIGMVHQLFNLIDDVSVIDNVLLLTPLSKREKLWLIKDKFALDFRKFAEEMGLPIDPFIKVRFLPAGLKQRVEILRLLYLGTKVLIFDEPTSMLTPLESKELFKFIRNVKSQSSIVWVTHRLNEVNEICDRITILRGGKVVKYYTEEDVRNGVELAELAYYMVGDAVVSYLDKIKGDALQNTFDKPILKIDNVVVKDDYNNIKVKGINLTLYKGEILGIAGVSGNGQKELVEAILGCRSLEKGSIIFNGIDITLKSISERLKMGLAYIPADRLERGLADGISIAENIYAYWVNTINRFNNSIGILNKKCLYDKVINLIKEYNIKTIDPSLPVRILSGGNLQKLLIARVLQNPCVKVVIAEELTAGLDIKTMQFIHRKIIESCKQGISFILISSELDELLKLSDRLAVIYDGKITKIYNNNVDNIDLMELSEYMMGIKY